MTATLAPGKHRPHLLFVGSAENAVWVGPGLPADWIVRYGTGGDRGLVDALPTTEVVLAYDDVPASIISAAPRLRLVQALGTGTDHIDLATAARLGVPLATLPGANARSVAEHALLLTAAMGRSSRAYRVWCRPDRLWRGGSGTGAVAARLRRAVPLLPATSAPRG